MLALRAVVLQVIEQTQYEIALNDTLNVFDDFFIYQGTVCNRKGQYLTSKHSPNVHIRGHRFSRLLIWGLGTIFFQVTLNSLNEHHYLLEFALSTPATS